MYSYKDKYMILNNKELSELLLVISTRYSEEMEKMAKGEIEEKETQHNMTFKGKSISIIFEKVLSAASINYAEIRYPKYAIKVYAYIDDKIILSNVDDAKSISKIPLYNLKVSLFDDEKHATDYVNSFVKNAVLTGCNFIDKL